MPCSSPTEHDVDLVLVDAAAASRERPARRRSRGRARARALRRRGTRRRRRRARRARGDAVRRRRARLGRDRGRRLAGRSARHVAPAARNRGGSRRWPARRQQTPRPRLDARAAGGRDRHRAGARPRRRGRRPRGGAATPACSSSGLSDRWRTEGIGPVRRAVAAGAGVPTLFVRRGLRPSGVAPDETLTRFTWTLASQRADPRA